MKRQNKVSNDTEEIKVYQNPWKNLLIGICCLLFAILGINIIADDNCRIATKIMGGWLGSIFFGVGGLCLCVTSLYNYLRHLAESHLKKVDCQAKVVLCPSTGKSLNVLPVKIGCPIKNIVSDRTAKEALHKPKM